MKNYRPYEILLPILILLQVFFWIEIYSSFTTEYDENWGHFFITGLIAILGFVLFLLFKKGVNSEKKKFRIPIKLLVISCPLSFIGIILYLSVFQMRTESISHKGSNNCFIEKKKNLFVAENLLVCNGQDTIIAKIKRNGKTVKIYRNHNGHEFQLSIDSLDNRSIDEKIELLTY